MPAAYIFMIAAFLMSFIMGCIIIPRILVISHKHQLYDLPDERKIHDTPIPRLGGLSFFPVIVVTLAMSMAVRYLLGYDVIYIPERIVLIEFLFLLAGTMILYVVGVGDDLIGITYRSKFIAQIICGVLLVLSGLWLHNLDGIFGIYAIRMRYSAPLTVFIVVYITNAFNLIDGVDGLASGLVIVALTAFGLIFISERQLIYALVSFSTLGVVVPFWFYNVFGNQAQGHKLFMGDTGSLTLGFIISFLTLRICLTGAQGTGATNHVIVCISALLVPMFDVFRVALHRIRKGRNPFKPDRNHIHHKLLRAGMRKRSVLISIIGLSVFYMIFNYLINPYLNVTYILMIDFALWIGLHAIINHFIKKVEIVPHSI
jgi:UDP-N-acetylmuramyl pentapeptide phosphotransferase/UDP-N-acetylglucosamine-1-phosphate transferase